MYARATRVQAQPGRFDELTRSFTATALPALRAIPGYAGSVLAVDRRGGDGQAVTFWESRDALVASRDRATGIRTETTQAGGATVVSVQEYEIALMERVTQPSVPAFQRVMRAQVDPSQLDAMVQATREEALPVLRDLEGFRALVVSIDRDSGQMAITSVWHSQQTRDASEPRMAPIRQRIFAMGRGAAPEVSLYETLSVEFVGAGALAR